MSYSNRTMADEIVEIRIEEGGEDENQIGVTVTFTDGTSRTELLRPPRWLKPVH